MNDYNVPLKICIVGGGNAAMISALILKQFLMEKVNIEIIYSDSIGTIGVGEGSTEHFTQFMNFVGITRNEIIKECGSTLKYGIKFINWSKKDYIHGIAPEFYSRYSQYPITFLHCLINDIDLHKMEYKNDLVQEYFLEKEIGPFYQFHFDSIKLNFFLKNKCIEKDINIVEDTIKEVVLDSRGYIKHVVGNKNKYFSNLYIDSTGFKRVLISKMNYHHVSFKNYLKMNSAITFPTKKNNDFSLCTDAVAMNFGWRFKIPLYERNGNGYIFDSNYITADQAKEELDKEFGFDVEISKQFNFDPGYLKNVWINNCIAVGLSGSFVEPLEATSIGTTINQSFLLMNLLIGYNEQSIKKYNESFEKIMLNIRDFIVLHYIVEKENSIFWKDLKKIDIPDSLLKKLKSWENRLPIIEDIETTSTYNLFNANNYLSILNGINFFENKNFIKNNYLMLPEFIKNEANLSLKKLNDETTYISHKKFIDLIRLYG